MISEEFLTFKNEIKNRITKLEKLSKKDDKFDPELLADYTKYLVILVAGLLEKGITDILIKFCNTKKTDSYIINYIREKLKYFINPDMGKIKKLLDQFNKEWRKNLTEIKDDKSRDYSEYKDQIDTLIKHRNKIAHCEVTNINLSQLKEHYNRILDFLTKLEKIINEKLNN